MRSVLALVSLLLGMPSVVFASGGPGPVLLSVNFVVFVAIMYFLVRKPAAAMWFARIKNLDSEIRKGAIALEAAEVELNKIKDKYSDLDKSIAELTERIKVEAIHESDLLLAQANKDKLRILEQAKKNIEREIESQEKSIKNKFAHQVCEQAEAKLKVEFNSDFDRSYRQSSLQASLEANGETRIQKLAGRR